LLPGTVTHVALQDELAGTFRLVSLETRRVDGGVSWPFGRDVTGMFTFDRAGNYSVQLFGESSMAMFGTYVVDDAQQTFTLTPTAALDPAMIGTEVLRHVDLSGEHAVFNTPTQVIDGVEAVTYITWQKVAST